MKLTLNAGEHEGFVLSTWINDFKWCPAFLVDGILIPILETSLTFKVHVEKIEKETVPIGDGTIRT